jgi:hypothetical protein
MQVPPSLPSVELAPALGLVAYLVLLALLLLSLGTGLFVCRLLRVPQDGFLALVVGYAALAHGLLLGDLIAPGAHPAVAAAFVLPALAGFIPALAGFSQRRAAPDSRALDLVALVGLFVIVWCWDLGSRLAHFRATGELRFWVDILVHAGNVAQFASPDAIGRGLILMADWPRFLYHNASLMPVALLARLAGAPVLDATVLVWIPLGILVMASGVVALGKALGGPTTAALGLLALAAVPAPERWTLGNGLLGFSWLLETSPGTAYSLGVSCAALAALVRAARDPGIGAAVLAAALTLACLLVRVNTFVWLAPVMALGAVVVWHRPGRVWRIGLVAAGVAGSVAVLLALSWPAVLADARQFVFGYAVSVHTTVDATRIDGLLPALSSQIGPVGTGVLAILLVFVGTLGPWGPAFLLLGGLAWRRGRLTRSDALPLILVLVAAVAIMLAPQSRNGDITEFRHRAGPLLVVVFAVWTCHVARLSVAWQPGPRGLAAAAAVCLAVLAGSIATARRPVMAWTSAFYGTHVAPDLMALAAVLRTTPGGSVAARPRFAVAGQPADSRNMDPAAAVVALSGVPAYLSCPGFMVSTGGAVGIEAQRRLAVIARMDAAQDLSDLRTVMRSEGITHYVVTAATDAQFDPQRRAAAFRVGSHAVYLQQ